MSNLVKLYNHNADLQKPARIGTITKNLPHKNCAFLRTVCEFDKA